MLNYRLIPIILIEEGRMVKTVNFKNPKYVGDPINAVRIFNEKLVDEIMLVDMSVSKLNKSPDIELIESIASECFMPLSYSGGIKKYEDVEKIFSVGVEKVTFQTVAFYDIELIKKTINHYGAQSVAISVDVKKDWLGKYKIYNHVLKKKRPENLLNHIKIFNDIGVGEIIINSVDMDGTLKGPDLDLLKILSDKINVPLIYNGGISSIDDIEKVFNFGCSVAAGSFFVFHGPHKAVLITYPSQNQISNILT